MTATTTSGPLVAAPVAARPSRARSVVTFVVAAVVAVLVSWAAAGIALLLGANATFAPLAISVFAPFVVIGLAAAYVGWRIIRRRAQHPAAVLKVLVPVLTVLSFIPDAVLAVTGFIPGASLTAVVALAFMHLIVAGTAVLMSSRLAPVR